MKPAHGTAQIGVGRISGIFGVSGWVKVISWTRPITNIFSYTPWLVGEGEQQESRDLLEGRVQGKGLIARLRGLEDRDVARSYIGKRIALYRHQMPELPAGQYYWCDLMELEVTNTRSILLGKITGILETGANDVLVIEGEHRHLVPLMMGRYVQAVDLAQGRMTVDWEPEYS